MSRDLNLNKYKRIAINHNWPKFLVPCKDTLVTGPDSQVARAVDYPNFYTEHIKTYNAKSPDMKTMLSLDSPFNKQSGYTQNFNKHMFT